MHVASGACRFYDNVRAGCDEDEACGRDGVHVLVWVFPTRYGAIGKCTHTYIIWGIEYTGRLWIIPKPGNRSQRKEVDTCSRSTVCVRPFSCVDVVRMELLSALMTHFSPSVADLTSLTSVRAGAQEADERVVQARQTGPHRGRGAASYTLPNNPTDVALVSSRPSPCVPETCSLKARYLL